MSMIVHPAYRVSLDKVSLAQIQEALAMAGETRRAEFQKELSESFVKEVLINSFLEKRPFAKVASEIRESFIFNEGDSLSFRASSLGKVHSIHFKVLDGYVYFVTGGDDAELVKLLELDEFSYWNNTDRPENLSEYEWDERRDIWNQLVPGLLLTECGFLRFDWLSEHLIGLLGSGLKKTLVRKEMDRLGRDGLRELYIKSSIPGAYLRARGESRHTCGRYVEISRLYQKWLAREVDDSCFEELGRRQGLDFELIYDRLVDGI